MNDSPPDTALNDKRLQLIAESYLRLTGRRLINRLHFDPLAMWNASHAIVAHGTEEDPVFFYGNKLALQLFELSFEDFVRLPSRLSAEAPERQARIELMEKVTRQGFVDNYCGERISSSGRRFMIQNGTVWNLIDAAGVYHGQAASFIAQK